MSGTERFVRHVRLAAHSEADVRCVLPRLEDAMRCASLADDGARLRVVRKLALGRISRDMSSQALARAIEQQLATAAVQWIEGGSPAAEQAVFVQFASSFDACLQLCLRLVRSESCSAWYWPLAVPGFRADRGTRHNLRAVAGTLAQLPEAALALPMWAACLVDAGGAAALSAAISEHEGSELLRHVGMTIPHERVWPARREPSRSLHGQDSDGSIGAREHVASDEATWTLPAWLMTLLAASGQPRYQMLAGASVVIGEKSGAPLTKPEESGALAQSRAPLSTQAQGRAANMPAAYAAAGPSAGMDAARPTQRRVSALGGLAPTAAASESQAQASLAPATAQFATERSQYAGLLFLLPVLARLGLPEWAGEQAPQFARCVLRQLLHRLKTPVEDAAWSLVEEMTDGFHPVPKRAPSCWADAQLGAPGTRAALGVELAAAADVDAQALLWLAAARRYLRRGGGLGLASLVQRPGRIGITPTHLDLHFSINDIDMRVRRLGLDIDPGWLPWFGRVISYHYSRDLT